MEVIEKIVEYKRPDEFYIYPIGDIHIGSIHCAENDIKEKIREIAHQKNAYIIGMGDYAECIVKDDKRFDMMGLSGWVTKDNIIESQRERVVELFKPVRHKIIALLTGNHEESIHTSYQYDFTRNICKDLGVLYGGYAAFILLLFKRLNKTETPPSRLFKVHAWHGAGAAQTEGARLMRLMRLVNEAYAHVYLMGHLHAMTQHTPDRLECISKRIKSTKLAATITGSWLKTYTQPKEGENIGISYAEKQGYKPSRIGCPCIKIVPDKNTFTIES